MEDGDTEKYNVSRLIQDVVLCSRKMGLYQVFHRRYIMKSSTTPEPGYQWHTLVKVNI